MKDAYIIFIGAILLASAVAVIAQVATTKEVVFNKADAELLRAKGFDNLGYSAVWCDVNSCYYNITRADRDVTRNITGARDRDADITSFMQESLTMLKSIETKKARVHVGTIVVVNSS